MVMMHSTSLCHIGSEVNDWPDGNARDFRHYAKSRLFRATLYLSFSRRNQAPLQALSSPGQS